MYDYCTPELQKQFDAGRKEELKQLEEETKRLIESKGKDKEEEKMPLLLKSDKKEDKEQMIADEVINMPLGKIKLFANQFH
jgi:hypothetical protein